ncbi:MAG: hypothetical protein COY19_11705, partial [Candidatus Marinimicrobia bacterium CG_4_10_14_0_2_um_filter_48_9]
MLLKWPKPNSKSSMKPALTVTFVSGSVRLMYWKIRMLSDRRSPMTDFDVIVVGGGPAGSMAAWYAVKGGAKTIILEKDRDIGYPVRCGEAVSDAGLRQFLEPRPSWIASTISKIRMVSPDGSVVDTAGSALGYILHRRMFDYDLANIAAQAGAQVLTKAY